MTLTAWFWMCTLVIAFGISIHATLLSRHTKTHKYYSILAAMGFSVSFWILCQLLIQFPLSETALIVCHEVKYLAILLLPNLLYIYSYTFRYNKPMPSKLKYAYLSTAIPFVVIIGFPPFRSLFRLSLKVLNQPTITMIQVTNGPAFYMLTLYVYAMIFISLLNFIAAYKLQPSAFKSVERTMIIAIIIPTFINIFYLVASILNMMIFDPTPIGFFISLIIFYYTVVFSNQHQVIYQRRGMMVEMMDEALLFLNHYNTISDANRSFLALIDMPLKAIIDKPLNAIESPLFGVLNRQLEDDLPQTEYTCQINNEEHYYQLTYKSVVSDKKKPLGSLFVLTDISSYKKTYLDLQFLTIHDSLTGLFNRYHFNKEIERLNSYHYYPLGLCYCYLRDLKKTNDIMGHQKGDQLLSGLAKHLSQLVNGNDMVFRTGSDEFTLLFPNTTQSEMQLILESMEALNPYFPENPLRITYAIKTNDSQSLIDFKKEASNL